MAGSSLSLAKLGRASATHVAFAFTAMGGWAWFANRAHGSAAIPPALAQGVLSGAITFVLKRALDAMAARLDGLAAYALPPLASASTILALLFGVHRMIGTPEIAATIAVPWSVSTGYAVIYTAIMARGRSPQA